MKAIKEGLRIVCVVMFFFQSVYAQQVVWKPQGPFDTEITDLLLVKADSVVFAKTVTSALHRSLDQGKTWQLVNENEFNVSQNPSAVEGERYIKNSKYPIVSSIDGVSVGSFDDYEVSGSTDQTGSYLAPFITTIGLYDDDLNIVAVAKLLAMN